MTKQKKIIDDEHYVALINSLLNATSPDDPHALTVRSRDARILYHTAMKQLVISTAHLFGLSSQPEVRALCQYHDELIAGDVNHQHPKNLYSELFKLAGNATDPSQRKAIDMLKYTIPIDGTVPHKLVTSFANLPDGVERGRDAASVLSPDVKKLEHMIIDIASNHCTDS